MSWETDEARMAFVSDGPPKPKPKAVNTNSLEGFRCPACKSLGPFDIETNCRAVWTDDGAADITTPEMVAGGIAHCFGCVYMGKIESFRIPDANDDD